MPLSSNPARFSFTPEDDYEIYRSRRKKKVWVKRSERDNFNWKAPEHARITCDMQRDFPRDELGVPLRGSKKEFLVLDSRPEVLKPQRKTYPGWL